jgi:hypothetical protein
MDVVQTITRPWRDPADYFTLVFWIVIFAVVSFIIFDMLNIVITSMKIAAKSTVEAAT